MTERPSALVYHAAQAMAAPRVLVIAEIGVNHGGDPSVAGGLIAAAAEAGADAVKFQYFRADRLLSVESRLAEYQQGQAEDARQLLKGLELSIEALSTLRTVAGEAGLGFLVTPFSLDDVEELEPLAVDGLKIASPDAVNRPLLDAVAGLNRPVFVSTGTCELLELEAAADTVGRCGGALLHCVSAYPTPESDATLGAIGAMRRWLEVRPGAPIALGYSDHTQAEDTGALAVAAGAVVLEKHLTADRGAEGPDHRVSLDPAAFGRYVAAVRRAERIVGPQVKTRLPVEADVAEVSRQSVCAARCLPAGHRLTRRDLTVKRPGTGLPAKDLERALGRRTRRAVVADALLRADDIDWSDSAGPDCGKTVLDQ